MKQTLNECVGTLLLVVIIGLSGDPLAIGVGLAILIYAGGPISGAHYNPAVSLAMVLRRELSLSRLWPYWAAQIVGAIAGVAVIALLGGSDFEVKPPEGPALPQILLAEFLFTYLLVFVILNVATNPAVEGNSYFGLAIGLTVATGAFCVGSISGAAFNPAVALGSAIADLTFNPGDSFRTVWIYLAAPITGSLVAVFHYSFTFGRPKDQ